MYLVVKELEYLDLFDLECQFLLRSEKKITVCLKNNLA